jgi:hypothetical protein
MGFLGSIARATYNIISAALGLGLTRNIVNCYAAILRYWEPNDRIFLIGFSRGAYTVRCLAAVLAKCGVPDFRSSLAPRSPKAIEQIARAAVRGVYQYTSSWERPKATGSQNELLDQRDRMATQFRSAYGAVDAYPHFIGVFDTVASLSNPSAAVGLIVIGTMLVMITVSIVYFLIPQFALPLALLALTGAFAGAAVYVASLIRYWPADQGGPGFLRSAHLTELRMNFYDKTLNENVGFARHAISIDERRKSFTRVGWGSAGVWKETKPIWFDQTWFAGDHADIGGGNPDNESALSDHALEWMAASAEQVGLCINRSALHIFARDAGTQHDEMKSSAIFRWAGTSPRKPEVNALLHGSALDRFAHSNILNFDRFEPYRPPELRCHRGVYQYYIVDNLLMSHEPALALEWVREDIHDAIQRDDYANVYAWQRVEWELLRRRHNSDSESGAPNETT